MSKYDQFPGQRLVGARANLADSRWLRRGGLQRMQVLAEGTRKSASGASREHKPVPFTGMPELKPLEVRNYALSSYIRRVIEPSESICDAVAAVMVNLFISADESLHAPGKHYPATIRRYNREQLKVFTGSLTVLDLLFYYYRYMPQMDGTGRFTNKEEHHIKTLGALLGNPIWYGTAAYDLIHMHKPGAFCADLHPSDAEDFASGVVQERHGEELKAISFRGSRFDMSNASADVQAINMELSGLLVASGESVSQTDCDMVRKYIQDRPDLSQDARTFLGLVLDSLVLSLKLETEMQAELVKLPKEPDIIAKIAARLKPNGALILESEDVRDVPGLKFIGAYGEAALYQKIVQK